MKNIILTLLLISTTIFSQTSSSKSILLTENSDNRKIESAQLPSLLPETGKSKKSGMLAALYSLVLPGMGELYAGSYNSGKYFTIAEGVIWGVFIGYNTYGGWQKNNYESYASSFAGISAEGKDENYYANLGDYISVDEYNRQKGLFGEFDQMYDPQKFYWNWKTDSRQKEYRNMWVSSEQSYNNVRFAVGALIVNRIISAFNAARQVRSYNRNIDNAGAAWNLSVGYNPAPNAPSNMSLNFQTAF